MSRLIGYMLTWNTYGSWLQGDERGGAKDSRLLRANEKLLQKPAVKLNKEYKQLVRDEICKTADAIGQELLSIAVCSDHVHIVVNNIDDQIGNIVRQ